MYRVFDKYQHVWHINKYYKVQNCLFKAFIIYEELTKISAFTDKKMSKMHSALLLAFKITEQKCNVWVIFYGNKSTKLLFRIIKMLLRCNNWEFWRKLILFQRSSSTSSERTLEWMKSNKTSDFIMVSSRITVHNIFSPWLHLSYTMSSIKNQSLNLTRKDDTFSSKLRFSSIRLILCWADFWSHVLYPGVMGRAMWLHVRPILKSMVSLYNGVHRNQWKSMTIHFCRKYLLFFYLPRTFNYRTLYILQRFGIGQFADVLALPSFTFFWWKDIENDWDRNWK